MGFDIVTASRHALCVKVSYGTRGHDPKGECAGWAPGCARSWDHGCDSVWLGVTRCDGCQKCQNMIALKSLKSLLLKEQGGLGPARTMFFIEFLKSFFVSLLLLAPFGVEWCLLRHGINYLCLPWYFFKNHISCHVYKSYIMFLFNFFSLYLFSIFSSCIPSLCENIVFFRFGGVFLPVFWPLFNSYYFPSGDLLHFSPTGRSVLAAGEPPHCSDPIWPFKPFHTYNFWESKVQFPASFRTSPRLQVETMWLSTGVCGENT